VFLEHLLLSRHPTLPESITDLTRVSRQDADANEDPLAPETVHATLASQRVISSGVASGGEGSERVMLTENGANSAVFTGIIRTALRTAAGGGDTGEMNAVPGDTLVVSYEEKARGSILEDATKLATFEVHVGQPATLESTEVLNPGQIIYITVVDADLGLTAATVLDAVVLVTTSKDFEEERVHLTETGYRTNMFTGRLLTCTRCTSSTCPDMCFASPWESCEQVSLPSHCRMTTFRLP